MSLLTLYIGWIIGAANLITASGLHAVPLPEDTICTLDWVSSYNGSNQVWACYDPKADAVTNPYPSGLTCVPVNTYLFVIPLYSYPGVQNYVSKCPHPAEATS